MITRNARLTFLAVATIALLVSLGTLPGCAKAAAGDASATIYRDSFGVPHVMAETSAALMYAGGYALMQDRMAEFEFIRIEEREGVLIYISMPNGRGTPTLFALRSLEGGRAVFENAEHDLPQRIIYWKAGADLRARIEGTTRGKTRSMEWTWKPSSLTP